MVYFNARKIIMAVQKVQQQQVAKLDGNSIPALRIFEWARVQLNKTEAA